MCRQCADDVRTTYVIRHLKSPTKSHSCVVCTSSACHPRVVCMSYARRTHETSVPRLFQVKQQRTALLKIHRCFQSNGFNQLIEQLTTDQGSLLDHVYFNGVSPIQTEVSDTYYSDHDCTIIAIANTKSQS